MSTYEVEFQKAGEIYALHLSYRHRKLHPREVEHHLRDEINQWKAKCSTDILASPWFLPQDADGELLPLEDGSTHIAQIQEAGKTLEKLLTLLQSAPVERDRFVSHLYQSRRQTNRKCAITGF